MESLHNKLGLLLACCLIAALAALPLACALLDDAELSDLTPILRDVLRLVDRHLDAAQSSLPSGPGAPEAASLATLAASLDLYCARKLLDSLPPGQDAPELQDRRARLAALSDRLPDPQWPY